MGQQGRKVFTLQTLPACDEPFDDGVGKVAGFPARWRCGAGGSTPEARTPMQIHQSTGNYRPASGAYVEHLANRQLSIRVLPCFGLSRLPGLGRLETPNDRWWPWPTLMESFP